jgi:hypothetical protein
MYPQTHGKKQKLYSDYTILLIKPSVESWHYFASMNPWSELCNTK